MNMPARKSRSLLALLLVSVSAWAGPELTRAGAVEVPASAIPMFRDVVNNSGQESRKPNGQVLRCWQEGRLLYEGSGFRGMANGGSSALNLARNGAPDITVLDLKQGLCILSGN